MAVSKRAEDRDAEFDNATAFEISKPVDLESLTEEFRKSAGFTERKQISVIAEGDIANASDKNPITVWLVVEAGDKPDVNAFKKVVTKHKAEARENVLTPLLAKVQNEEELTPEELQVAVRHLLLRRSRGM